MESFENKRMNADINTVRTVAERAEEKADMANNNISQHEKICAIRYDTITKQLDNIPAIYNEIRVLSKWVYIGVGLCTGIVGISEIVQAVHKISGG